MLTKNGICYDLSKTPFEYKEGNTVYKFSSQLHLDKFVNKLKENRDVINYSLSRRFNMHVNVSNLADIILYKKIENRGFLVIVDDIEHKHKEKLCYNNGNITFNNN